MNKYYLAIDLGASSGRHIVGYLDNGEIVLKEIYRFKTQMEESAHGLIWDLDRIFNEIKIGIKKAFEEYPKIESLAIDSWGVDYVLMNGDKEIKPYYAYRNKRNMEASEHVNRIIPFEELYKLTGVQFAPFNTIYALYADKLDDRLLSATDYLMIPSYFTYKLTGIKTHEYTNESTTSLINPWSKKYQISVIEKLELPKRLFKDINSAGDHVGELTPEIAQEVGGNCKVILTASHDTASAFEAVDLDDDSVLISSGTWSLLGIKASKPIISDKSLKANFTNEGGVGYIRFLKNIMGMWVASKVKNELFLTLEYIDEHINEAHYYETFDINDPSLLAPSNMKEAIYKLLKKNPPKDELELFASIYHSMAKGYKTAIEELEAVTSKTYKNIIIVGGGAKNIYLNHVVEEYTKKTVIPKPIEATALGNIKIQMKADQIKE